MSEIQIHQKMSFTDLQNKLEAYQFSDNSFFIDVYITNQLFEFTVYGTIYICINIYSKNEKKFILAENRTPYQMYWIHYNMTKVNSKEFLKEVLDITRYKF